MIRLYHLEKFAIMREAFQYLSAGQKNFSNVGDGDSGKLLFEILPFLNVGVILIDIELERESEQPIHDSTILCNAIRNTYPKIQIILHCPYRHAVWVDRLIIAGVKGFVSKNSNFQKIEEAISAVDAGKYYLCPLIASQFSNLNEFLENNAVVLKPVNPMFSKREMEVLDLISTGLSNREIAEKLFLSIKTVETHRKKLIEKAKVKNTAELIKFVSSRGLLLH